VSQPVTLRHKVSHFVTNCDTLAVCPSDSVLHVDKPFYMDQAELGAWYDKCRGGCCAGHLNECYKNRNRL
jgi:hypothetical protein